MEGTEGDVAPDTEAESEALAPAPPEPPPAPVVAPPAPPPVPPPAVLPPARGPLRRPLGLSGPAAKTLGWVTFAVGAAAGIGLTTAGIVDCRGEGLDCIQGSPLVWSGAVVGLSGIPIGLTLIVRGNQLSVETPVARVPAARF